MIKMLGFDSVCEMIEDINQYDDKNDQDIKDASSTYKCFGTLKMRMNVLLITNYLKSEVADKLFEGLKKVTYNTDEESMIKIMGKKLKIPRKQIAFGNPDTNYHFSGTNVKAYDWNQTDLSVNSKVARELKEIAKMAGETACVSFNYALVNNYLDQTKCIGYHSDDEKELGQYAVIAGISLGEERSIYFKSKLTDEVIKISLPHGSMYIMFFPTNKYWKHSIPRTTKHLGQRISITFRGIGKV